MMLSENQNQMKIPTMTLSGKRIEELRLMRSYREMSKPDCSAPIVNHTMISVNWERVNAIHIIEELETSGNLQSPASNDWNVHELRLWDNVTRRPTMMGLTLWVTSLKAPLSWLQTRFISAYLAILDSAYWTLRYYQLTACRSPFPISSGFKEWQYPDVYRILLLVWSASLT
jgi:hypothetical protein